MKKTLASFLFCIPLVYGLGNDTLSSSHEQIVAVRFGGGNGRRSIGRWHCQPRATYFKPNGIPLTALQEVVLTKNECQVLHLIDVEGESLEKTAQYLKE